MSAALSDEVRKSLGDQLIRLGDMMGDGLHLEPDGKWISEDYRRVMRALGHTMPRKPRTNIKAIDERMAQRVAEQACLDCGGVLKQARSGSMKARCVSCQAGFTLLTVKRGKK